MAQQITIKLAYKVQQYEVEVPLTSTFGEIKALAQEVTGLPQTSFRLLFRGREQPDGQSILHAGIKKGSVIQMAETPEHRERIAEALVSNEAFGNMASNDQAANGLQSFGQNHNAAPDLWATQALQQNAAVNQNPAIIGPLPPLGFAPNPLDDPGQQNMKLKVALVRSKVNELVAQVEQLQQGQQQQPQQAKYLLEMLTQQLLVLDNLEVSGAARMERKAEIDRVNAMCDLLERLKSSG